MSKCNFFILFIFVVLICLSNLAIAQKNVYNVNRLSEHIKIDGKWNKPAWKKCKSIHINYFMEVIPKFYPNVQAKMMYDSNNLYVIFRVKDKFVKCTVDTINGPVWENACVEFFFAPDTAFPLKYFNLEINCGGTALMCYNAFAHKCITTIDTSDIKKIEIAHSLPKKIVDEIKHRITWTLEYKLPISMIAKYSTITMPKQGIVWRANFYKISHKLTATNPHYISWNFIEGKVADFHKPQFFGEIRFQ